MSHEVIGLNCVINLRRHVSLREQCAKCFQKYLSEDNIIILSLNTVIPNHFYGLAIKGDSMPPQIDYLSP